MTEVLLPFLTAVLALMIIPGPDMALVVANAVAYGMRGAFFTALGISSGGIVLALTTALLVAGAVSVNAQLLVLIQLLGCLYLLFIAAITIYPQAAKQVDQKPTVIAKGNLFLLGVITNIANPKAIVFFSAFIPQFVPGEAANPLLFTLYLGSLLCLVGFCINFTLGIAGTTLIGLNNVALWQRSWKQWIIFTVFSGICLVFALQIINRIYGN